ncbi:MAG: hypothetical protein AB1746_07750 [Candidatus Zixiibacteriota bacterium]
MTKLNESSKQPFHPDEIDLAGLTDEELEVLKDAIISRSKKQVGPEGFNPTMMETNGSLFDPLALYGYPADLISQIMNLAFRRISLAILTAGLGFLTAGLYQAPMGVKYAGISLAATAVSAIWFVVDMVRVGRREMQK